MDSDEIGQKIRDLRQMRNLTQEEVADRCELTKGYISQLENGTGSPSIATLVDILTQLGSSLKEFFSDDDNEAITFKTDDMFEKSYDGEKIVWLVPSAQKNAMEPILVELDAHSSTDEDIPHDGEEFGYVLEGTIKLTVGKKTDTVKKGESFYYKAARRHKIENATDKKARFIWVSCPPQF